MVNTDVREAVAYAGFVQGGGFNHAGPEKADERGGRGLRHIFFLCVCVRHLHYWVGVPSVYQTDLRGDKKKKKKKSGEKRRKKKPISKGGGGGGFEPPEPPLRTRLA